MSNNKKSNNGQLWENDIIHLVFEPSAKALLEKSFDLSDNVRGAIFTVHEDYSVASIRDIYAPEGWQQRKAFWKGIQQQEEEETDDMSRDKLEIHTVKKQLAEEQSLQLWIWMGQNERDVCGYYWLVSQLKEFEGRVHVLYLNNLPFINEKENIFYPVHLSEILPGEFVKARRLNRPVSAAEIELDGDEWKKLCNEEANIRTLEGAKKIVSQPDNYFDGLLISTLGGDTYKLPRLLAQLFTKHRVSKPERFWMWRLKHLAEANVLVANGDWERSKELSFRKNSGRLFEQVAEEDAS